MFELLTLKLNFILIYKISVSADLTWPEFPTGSCNYTWLLLMSMRTSIIKTISYLSQKLAYESFLGLRPQSAGY